MMKNCSGTLSSGKTQVDVFNNINQLVKLAHHKNLRNPNVGLQDEMQRTNGLLLELVEILGEKKTG